MESLVPLSSMLMKTRSKMAVDNLQQDIFSVCGTKPEISTHVNSRYAVLVGTYRSPLIQRLLSSGKLNKRIGRQERKVSPADRIFSLWRSGKSTCHCRQRQTRSCIYGIYELSGQIGVSPWYWWADVPVHKHKHIYIKPGIYTDGEPKVEYRGIFINDEWPCMGNWAKENSATSTAHFISMFSNWYYVWRAILCGLQCGEALYDDDPQNGVLAHTMGVVMGTSHHEPMALAQQDWKRHGKGAWDYTQNKKERSQRFLDLRHRTRQKLGIRNHHRNARRRRWTDERRRQYLIIGEYSERPTRNHWESDRQKADKTPQVWALYKEVQDYYDKGMRVPDDVTLLLCDDNWGNVRKLPRPDEKPRTGGYGMYYHFDYVGAPRNSKMDYINPIPRIWEQMHLTYEYGVRKLWIVNVGDLKPMEYPITFFLDMAWNPDKFNAQNLQQHAEEFCARQIRLHICQRSGTHSFSLCQIQPPGLPKCWMPKRTASITANGNVSSMNTIRWRWMRTTSVSCCHQNTETLTTSLFRSPVQACSNLYNMYYAQAKNQALSNQKDPEANYWADKVASCFQRDLSLTDYYHKTISDGKWNHLMSQIHIG